MSITAVELKKLHMAAERGKVEKPNLDKDRLYMKLCEFGGIPEKVVDSLVGAGYMSLYSLKDASDADLESISGIGTATVDKIRDVL